MSDSDQRQTVREPSNEVIRSVAAKGVRTPSVPLPFLDRIQASFGHHSIDHVEAHISPEAAKASRAMNALAFASGNHVVFGVNPDLRTAAHEAAHIVQQRAGVQLTGGIGREEDTYERHADAVGDAVVAGRSAEVLLEAFAAPPKAKVPDAATRFGHLTHLMAPSPEISVANPLSTKANSSTGIRAVQRMPPKTGLNGENIDDADQDLDKFNAPVKKLKPEIGGPVITAQGQETDSSKKKKTSLKKTNPTPRKSTRHEVTLGETGPEIKRHGLAIDIDFDINIKKIKFDSDSQICKNIFVASLEKGKTDKEIMFEGLPYNQKSMASLNDIKPSDLLKLINVNHKYYYFYGKGVSELDIFSESNLIFFKKRDEYGKREKLTRDILGRALLIRYHILFDEPEPRSGLARAAADEDREKPRGPNKTEAKYAGAIKPIKLQEGETKYNLPNAAPNSTLTIDIDNDSIVNKLIHTGPWGKGSRTPGQAAVMGGQSAKNYALDHILTSADEDQKEAYRQTTESGRWEWLHIIGSSLGGINTLGNLVAGTYDANTKMIALEHRVALWSSKDYQDKANNPNPQIHQDRLPISNDNPLTIEGTAKLNPDESFVAEEIILKVLYGTNRTLLVKGEYNTLTKNVITKGDYKKEKDRVTEDLEKKRGLRESEEPEEESEGAEEAEETEEAF